MITSKVADQVAFSEFLNTFKSKLHSAFYERDNLEQFIQKRGFPALVLRDIMATNPFSVAIPKEYGGRGVKVKEILGMFEAASYESLPLSLTFGINMALFLEPMGKYAQDSVKASIFNRFLTQQNMGGLMITEPDYGSDALSMQTSNEKIGSNYRIQGTKHWQGLTGMADYWLMTSRAKDESGNLGRDVDFFVVDVQQPNQHIVVEEYYNNIGLYPIPYGRNKVDVLVPEQFKLVPESTGLKLMMDLLHRSRFHFPGMGMGFIHRLLDEAIKHTTTRIVGGKPLIALDQIQYQLSKIQSAFTITSAMCLRSAGYGGVENNLAGDGIEANSMKAYVTDMMQDSAQTLTQLLGANGYKTESLGARGIVDSRPFQIFEGSNEMLYTQLSEMVIKLMVRLKSFKLSDFFAAHELTKDVAKYYHSVTNFTVDAKLAQRKMVDLGKIISRVVSANMVTAMGDKGFRPDLIRDALATIKYEVATLAGSFHHQTLIAPIEDYSDESSWLAYC